MTNESKTLLPMKSHASTGALLLPALISDAGPDAELALVPQLNQQHERKQNCGHEDQQHQQRTRVLQLLKVPKNFSLRAANGDRAVPDGMIVVGDAETTADVQRWTESCDAQMLPAGGAEFFNALLERAGDLRPAGKRGSCPAAPADRKSAALCSGREFFIVGTATIAARKFIAAERRKKVAVFALPQELAWGATFSPAAVAAVTQRVVAAFALNSRVILNVGLPQVRDAEVAGRLSGHVVRVAERVLRSLPVENVFAEGGATAAELVRRMGWTRLEVVREFAPGVAMLAVEGKHKTLLTIKPGTYTWPAQWT